MRLLSLDYDPVYGDSAGTASFASDVSIFDYDVVIWDPASAFADYAHSYQQGLPYFPEGEAVQLLADATRRRTEFMEFVESGRVLVVIVRPPQKCYIDSGRRTYDGKGRNAVTTIHAKSFDLVAALPIADCKLVATTGKNFSVENTGPISALLRKYKANHRYQAIMQNPPGEVVARLPGTERVTSSIKHGRNHGYLIMLPALDFRADKSTAAKPDDPDYWLPSAYAFQVDLFEAIERLRGTGGLSRPAWAEHYVTAEQASAKKAIVNQRRRVEAARAKLATFQAKSEAVEAADQLFLGSGRALELEVKKVFELLGGTVDEAKPGRDDWRVTFPEGRVVLEVKGVSKSAAERYAAQLEKWVAGALDETGEAHKGVLVVNTWRETPLIDRNQKSFPDQMLGYSVLRNHCLVTGLQLFYVRAEVEKDPSRAAHWRKALISTVGQLEGCDDWQSVLAVTKIDQD